MGIFDSHADKPFQIKNEGQEITIRFQRTGPNTGRISWNIPTPTSGCGKDAVQAYDGIVITISNKPANYLSTSPKDGIYYNADPTADADVHVGDKLDGALVVGAFYHDKTTTYVDVTDIHEKTPYYVSGYAVDNVGRYHREGVHAYSLPTGSEEWGAPDKAAKHDILIDVTGGIEENTPTGLNATTQYKFKIIIDKKEHEFDLLGSTVSTYGDLVSRLKNQLALLGDVVQSATPPFQNTLVYDAVKKELSLWDGFQYTKLPLIVYGSDPSLETIGGLLYNESSKELKMYDGMTWGATQYISSPHNPLDFKCDQAWFDGTNAWLYKITHWQKLYTYIQTRNPLLGPVLSCDHYWYNKNDGIVYVWNVDQKRWVDVDVIYDSINPNTVNYWYDEKSKKLKQWTGSLWAIIETVKIVEKLPETVAEYNAIANGLQYIYGVEENELYEFVGSNWVNRPIIAFNIDPRDRNKNTLWWNSTTDILLAWNALDAQWVQVTAFFQSDTDPSLPQPVPEDAAWYNPDTKELKLVFNNSCKTIHPIIWNTAPGNLVVGTIWYDSDDKKWYRWDGALFNQVYPIYSTFDPTSTIYYWYDSTNGNLFYNGSGSWAAVTFQTGPINLQVGMFWFNTATSELFMWDGKVWKPSIGLASVELIPPKTSRDRSILSFFTRGLGCANSIEVVLDGDLLLAHVQQPIIALDPVVGSSGRIGGAIYTHLGVGDDGSPDERRNIHDFVRQSLGYPVVQVELTKEQLDQCIDMALAELRKHSSFSYRRGVFFLDLKPNQQTYILTNKCVGFNKVVVVNSIHRHRGPAMSMGISSNDVFAQAALQRLYSLGSFDMLSYHLISSYMEELETIFANRIMFTWNELERELHLYNRATRNEKVLVDAMFERTEQDLMIDRNTTVWIKRWALAEAKKILSQGRGKFQNLPGPNGSTTLNAQELQQQAEDEMEKLREQLYNNAMQDLNALGMRAHFIMG